MNSLAMTTIRKSVFRRVISEFKKPQILDRDHYIRQYDLLCKAAKTQTTNPVVKINRERQRTILIEAFQADLDLKVKKNETVEDEVDYEYGYFARRKAEKMIANLKAMTF